MSHATGWQPGLCALGKTPRHSWGQGAGGMGYLIGTWREALSVIQEGHEMKRRELRSPAGCGQRTAYPGTSLR